LSVLYTGQELGKFEKGVFEAVIIKNEAGQTDKETEILLY
jgi:hypothetical protein